MILILVTLGGCMSNSAIEPAVRSEPRVAQTTAPPPTAQPRVTVIGTSVQSRPIPMTAFGQGDRPVLIMGGIHGDETSSVYVAQQLLAELRQHAAPAGVPVAIIPLANPDGYAAKKRQNSRGVDLNRNFPAKNWKKGQGRKNNGGEPLSEPESQALASVIHSLRPRLIISIHSIDNDRHCNNYDGPAENVARLMSQYNHYPVAPTIGYPTPGSLGSFAGIDRAIPMITLELPRTASGETAWKDNQQALLAAIAAAK
jgi:protein MpaA